MNLPATKINVEKKYEDCIINLKKEYYKSLIAMKTTSSESEDNNSLEDNVDFSHQLNKMEIQSSQKWGSPPMKRTRR